jgi:hypothetical protein
MKNGSVCTFDIIGKSSNDCSFRQSANMFRIAVLLEQQTSHFRTANTHRIFGTDSILRTGDALSLVSYPGQQGPETKAVNRNE